MIMLFPFRLVWCIYFLVFSMMFFVAVGNRWSVCCWWSLCFCRLRNKASKLVTFARHIYLLMKCVLLDNSTNIIWITNQTSWFVVASSKSQKQSVSFDIFSTVTEKKPFRVSITKVKQFYGQSDFVKRSQWTIDQLQQVNGMDSSKVGWL